MDYIGEVRKRMTLSTSQFQMSLKSDLKLCHESLKERLKGSSMLFAFLFFKFFPLSWLCIFRGGMLLGWLFFLFVFLSQYPTFDPFALFFSLSY